MNSLPKTVTRQRRDCDLNPGLSAPESSTLTTRLPSHPKDYELAYIRQGCLAELAVDWSDVQPPLNRTDDTKLRRKARQTTR